MPTVPKMTYGFLYPVAQYFRELRQFMMLVFLCDTTTRMKKVS